MALTKDFLIKLDPSLGESFQTYCRAEGRSQQSVFSQLIGDFIAGNNPAGIGILPDLIGELVNAGEEVQQRLLDEMLEHKMEAALAALHARKAARMAK